MELLCLEDSPLKQRERKGEKLHTSQEFNTSRERLRNESVTNGHRDGSGVDDKERVAPFCHVINSMALCAPWGTSRADNEDAASVEML
jgi:hypothetical protein